jgi:hypothetical protein
MAGNPLWIMVVTALMSGLIGALMTQFAITRRELRKFRVDTLKRVAANRYDLKGEEFTRALNEVFIVFNDVPDVMQYLAEFHKSVISRQPSPTIDDTLIKLFKAMCRSAKIHYEQFNDSFFLTPFNTKPTSMQPASTQK